ncbi:probable Ubinuclein-1 at N-terminal half [Coccomyxa sp. Obi]|nr:probable Ubinuclein-1 at N-terminal half [Coccomyxa sp. Obi]
MPASPALAIASQMQQKPAMTLKEQSEYAAEHLGPGRRIYVELTQEKHEINWRKLQKERAALKLPQPADQKEPAPAPVPRPKKKAKKAGPRSVFNSVIQKLEQQYMNNPDDDSDEGEYEIEEEDLADDDDTPKGADASDTDVPEAVGGFDDQYDMDDEWIDDSEHLAYYDGDRRKAKYSGFFINKGEIEKTGELVDVERPSPPKKRRKAKADPAQEEELPRDPEAKAKLKKTKGFEGEGAATSEEPRKVVKRKKRPEGEDAAAATGEEAKGEVSKKKRLNEEGGAGMEGKAEVKKARRPKDEAVIGEVRKVDRVKKAEKTAVPSQQSLGLQTTTDAPSSAAQPPATKETGGSIAHGPPVQPIVSAPEAAQQEATAPVAAPKDASLAAAAQLASAQGSLQDTGHQQQAQPAAPRELESGAGSEKPAAAQPDGSMSRAVRSAPRKVGSSKAEEFTPSKEVSAAIDLLREAAASAGPPKKDGPRSLPRQVNQVLPAFACAVMREAERDKAVQKHVVDIVMSFLEPFTSRANLQTRIKTEWERVRGGLAAADSLLKSEIAKKAKVQERVASLEVDADDDFVTTSPAQSQPGAFLDAGLEPVVYSYISKRLHSEGGSFSPDKEREIYSETVALFPPSTVTEEGLRKIVAKRDGSHSSPRDTQKERSQPSLPPAAAEALAAKTIAATSAQPAPQTGWELPAAAAAAAALGGRAEQRQRPASAEVARDNAGSEQGVAQEASAAGAQADAQQELKPHKSVWDFGDEEYTQWMQGLISKAVTKGADLKALAEGSASFKRGTAKSSIHSVLMTAGKEGMTIPAIITAANQMGLTGPSPWDGASAAKKSHISQIVNGDPAFAHVGKSLYALAAFPGVVNVPHKRKSKDTLASHGSQASQQTAPAPAIAPRTSDAAAPAPPSSDAQPPNAAAHSSAPSGQASLMAGTPGAAAGVSGGPASPGDFLATIAGLARERGTTTVPPAVLGSLPMMSPQQSVAMLAAAAAAAQMTPSASAAPTVAEGPAPASIAVEGGSVGPTAGGGGAQPSSQGNGRS